MASVHCISRLSASPLSFSNAAGKGASAPRQFLGAPIQLKQKASLKSRNLHACRLVTASAIEGPSTATSGGEYKSTPKTQPGDVANTSHSGYQNEPKNVGSAKPKVGSSGQVDIENNEGNPVKATGVESEQKHTGYENQAEGAHAEKGGAQGHAGYEEGEKEDPQKKSVSQSHAGYDNPPVNSSEPIKQGHSGFQASGRVTIPKGMGVSTGGSPAGARVGGQTGRKGGLRTRVVASATGAAVASSGQKESHAIKKNATVFVAGATGATGQKIVKALLARGLKVKAAVRNVDSAKEKLGDPSSDKNLKDKLEFVRADITSGVDSLTAAMKGSDAVVSALGARPSFDFKQPWKIDYQANVDLADACQKAGVKKLVVVSALLTNGAKLGQVLNPAYIFLNIFGLTLVAKHRAEEYIWKTGLDYTIVRPGGLDRGPAGNIVLGKEDTVFGGSVPREQVAEAATEALLLPEASYKVVEIISKQDAPKKQLKDQFASLPSVSH